MSTDVQPTFSVVIAIVSDTARETDTRHLEVCLEALEKQTGRPPVEIIVPYHEGVRGIEEAKRRFPDAVFLPVSDLKHPPGRGREHHDELRARGLAAARGEMAALIEDHGRPDRNWCGSLAKALERGAAAGGAIENGVDRPLNWAVYFCDFAKYGNPVAAGETAFASDANIGFRRASLEAIRPVWQESFHEPAVIAALRSRGEKVILSPDIVVYQYRTGLQFGGALRERYVWGRSFAAARTRTLGAGRRGIYALLSFALPAVLLLRIVQTVAAKGRHRSQFLKALPLLVPLAACWSWGECVGYLTGRPAV